MTPVLEAVLSKVSRVCASPGFRNERVPFQNTAAHTPESAMRIPQ